MADYKTHITTSSLLGVCYGTAAVGLLHFSVVEGALAGCLTGIAGMLPDLDSQSGRPVREVFGLTAALAPTVVIHRMLSWTHGNSENAMLLAILIYIAIRYGGSMLLGMISVHRGMFHSVPALLIAAELTYLGYHGPSHAVKTLMAIGVAIGFASHLVLDEIYSVQWNGMTVHLKASAGSAIKFFGQSWGANLFVYSTLCLLSYVVVRDEGWLPPNLRGKAPVFQAGQEEPLRR